MNAPQLDRLLCERLGIEGQKRWYVGDDHTSIYSGTETECREWASEHFDYCKRLGYTVEFQIAYPSLSTTGYGMLTLMSALTEAGFDARLEVLRGGSSNVWLRPNKAVPAPPLVIWEHPWRICWSGWVPPPLGVAITAAKALGIEVPE